MTTLRTAAKKAMESTAKSIIIIVVVVIINKGQGYKLEGRFFSPNVKNIQSLIVQEVSDLSTENRGRPRFRR